MGEVDVQNSPDRKWKIRKAQKKGNWFSAWGHNNCILIFLIVEILIESNVYIEQNAGLENIYILITEVLIHKSFIQIFFFVGVVLLKCRIEI